MIEVGKFRVKVRLLSLLVLAPAQTMPFIVLSKVLPDMRSIAPPVIDVAVLNRTKTVFKMFASAVDPVMVMPVFAAVPAWGPRNIEFAIMA